jgi:exodeoxyribonuclease VII small subunit
MNMATKKISYQEAYNELQSILSQIENDELDVDELTKNVKKASELIKLCKSKLFETETEIEKIIQDMDEDLVK